MLIHLNEIDFYELQSLVREFVRRLGPYMKEFLALLDVLICLYAIYVVVQIVRLIIEIIKLRKKA